MKQNHFRLAGLVAIVLFAGAGCGPSLEQTAVSGADQKARDTQRISDLKQVQNALEAYYTDHNAYPMVAKPTVLGTAGGNFVCLGKQGFEAVGCTHPYMTQVPVAPQPGNYSYQSVNGQTYTIDAALEGEVLGMSGKIQATQIGIGQAGTMQAP